MLERLLTLGSALLPWRDTFDTTVFALCVGYVLAQLLFCLSLRRMAMAIPGPERMCNPLGLWVLAVPFVGALSSFGVLRHVWHAAIAALDAHHVAPPTGIARGFAMTYGIARWLILVPDLLMPALLLQLCAAIGFLMRLNTVAKRLRTPDITTATGITAPAV
jgi:hypothetical protein